jgi:hypothetical protein
MKHYFIAFSLVFGLMFLSCDDTDASFLNETNVADSLGSNIDSLVYSDSVYLPNDTIWIPGDSIYFPVDSITSPGDSIVIDSTAFNQ